MKIIKYILGGLVVVLVLLVVIFVSKVHINDPLVNKEGIPQFALEEIGENSFAYGNNRLLKNDKGLWEMYLEGKPYQRGVAFGVMGRSLDRKSTRLNSSHVKISYAASCLKKKTK